MHQHTMCIIHSYAQIRKYWISFDIWCAYSTHLRKCTNTLEHGSHTNSAPTHIHHLLMVQWYNLQPSMKLKWRLCGAKIHLRKCVPICENAQTRILIELPPAFFSFRCGDAHGFWRFLLPDFSISGKLEMPPTTAVPLCKGSKSFINWFIDIVTNTCPLSETTSFGFLTQPSPGYQIQSSWPAWPSSAPLIIHGCHTWWSWKKAAAPPNKQHL